MNRKFIIGALSIALLTALIFSYNYIVVDIPVKSKINEDPRNKGISFNIRYDYFVIPSRIVFDLKSISVDNSPADVFRVLLQTASSLKNSKYSIVKLAYKGKVKFVIKGEYFSQLGKEYGFQNPVYTMRTFPENLYDVEGKQAYGTWTGGWLGVVGKQMEDFNDFHHKWYLDVYIKK